jgi:5,10-methylenetetrahydromethanopterin reductase
MTTLPKIGIRLHGAMTAKQCVEFAKAAEAAGFASIWFAENAFARGILPAAAACAVATKRLQISAGVFNPFSRHPVMMAMEVGALDELSNGRITLAIGSGIASATAKTGINPEKPFVATRDTLAIVRGLLRGEEVEHAGAAFSAHKVRLEYTPRSDIPIFLAGRGSLTVKLAGEAADGLIISNMCSIAFAAQLASLTQASRSACGREGPGGVVQYMPCAVHTDRAIALDLAKRSVGEMVPGFWALGQKQSLAKDALLGGTGVSEAEFAAAAAAIRAGGDPVQVLDERYAAAFALAGTPEECLAAAEKYGQAGVTELALTFSGPTALQDMHLLAGAFMK